MDRQVMIILNITVEPLPSFVYLHRVRLMSCEKFEFLQPTNMVK